MGKMTDGDKGGGEVGVILGQTLADAICERSLRYVGLFLTHTLK